jgi:uncharacterized protein YdeI (YjbR/CyaY-like superfamily)
LSIIRVAATIGSVTPDDLPVLAFADQAALEDWLSAEHERAPGIYVRLAKKGSGVPSVTYPELVESVLCFGWIDGIVRGLDERFYLQRITPRRARSIWSQKNVTTVAALSAAGRMRPAGLTAVAAAQADGRWERAYPGSAQMTVPDDLAAALAAQPSAEAAFAALGAGDRFAVVFQVHTAATPATRARRIAAQVAKLAGDGAAPSP